MSKSLVLGCRNFTRVVEEEGVVVDKTLLIKTLMARPEKVLIVTRPQGFGKTFFLSTLWAFLAKNHTDPSHTHHKADFFKSLAIAKDKAFCEQYLGQVPVISLSFQHIGGQTFEAAYRAFVTTMQTMVGAFACLTDSPNLSNQKKSLLRRWLHPDAFKTLDGLPDTSLILKHLITSLAKHTARPVVLMIDDYDTPLAAAADYGYYDEMARFIETVLSQALKDDPTENAYLASPLRKAILTGTLPWVSQSTITGFNNLIVNSVLSNDQTLGALFGMTEDECRELFAVLKIEAWQHECLRHYDSFTVAGQRVYPLSDVLGFAQLALNPPASGIIHPENDWYSSKGIHVIKALLGNQSIENRDLLEQLVNGENVELAINPKVTYKTIKEGRPTDLWTWLIHAGYLTVNERMSSTNIYRVRISNKAVREVFVRTLKAVFSTENPTFIEKGKALVEAATRVELDAMTDALIEVFSDFIVIKDEYPNITLPDIYADALKTLIRSAECAPRHVRIHDVAPNDSATICFTVGNGSHRDGVFIKICYSLDAMDIYDSAETALQRLNETNAQAFFTKLRCRSQHFYGIALSPTDCAIVGGPLPQTNT